MAGPDWTVEESGVDHRAGFLTVGRDRLVDDAGRSHDYHWVDRPDVVTVVAVADGDLVLVEQYRHRFDAATLECPAGLVEDGESFPAAARRELREETGYRAGSVRLLGTCRPTAWTTHEQGVVAATDLSPGEQDLDDSEFVTVHRVPAGETLAEIRSFGPTTGWTLSALSLARAEGVLE